MVKLLSYYEGGRSALDTAHYPRKALQVNIVTIINAQVGSILDIGSIWKGLWRENVTYGTLNPDNVNLYDLP